MKLRLSKPYLQSLSKRALRIAYTIYASAFFILTGCGYHLGEQGSAQQLKGSSLSIPYAINDVDGQLTDELVKTFAASGVFEYRPSNGALELQVKIVHNANDCIGWKYNREPDGKRNKDLICTEGKRQIKAEVTLIDTLNDEVLFGPVEVHAAVDFDYYEPDSIQDLSFIDSAGVRRTSVQFSLGQLDSTEGAYDAAWIPLSRLLAKKILDLILHASYY